MSPNILHPRQKAMSEGGRMVEVGNPARVANTAVHLLGFYRFALDAQDHLLSKRMADGQKYFGRGRPWPPAILSHVHETDPRPKYLQSYERRLLAIRHPIQWCWSCILKEILALGPCRWIRVSAPVSICQIRQLLTWTYLETNQAFEKCKAVFIQRRHASVACGIYTAYRRGGVMMTGGPNAVNLKETRGHLVLSKDNRRRNPGQASHYHNGI